MVICSNARVTKYISLCLCFTLDKMGPIKVTPTDFKPQPPKILENTNVTEILNDYGFKVLEEVCLAL